MHQRIFFQEGKGVNNRKQDRPAGAVALTERDRAIANIIADRLLSQKSGAETCVFTEEEQESIKSHNGMLKDFGNGNAHSGIDFVRDNHKFTEEKSSLENEVKKWTVRAILLAFISGAITAIVVGFKSIMKGG